MAKDFEILTYKEVKKALGDGRSHILVGNGFSIACDPVFRYPSLYEAAVKACLSPRAQAVFERLGTNNFEGVMKLLDDTHWVAKTYGLIDSDRSEMLKDVKIVKRTLIEAVAQSHLDHTGEVPDERKDAALHFFSTYHNIFTTNYDLLLYWVVMHAGENPPFQDGFRSDEEDSEAPYLVFSHRLGDAKGLYYIHGALHLYVSEGELRKHSWIRTGERLTELIRKGLQAKNYPLFVAEGTPEKKLQQIQSNGYLWYCLDKLARIKGPLVVFGHSLGPSDQHIANAIAANLDFGDLYIGLHGDPDSKGNRAIRAATGRMKARRRDLTATRRRARELTVKYFDSKSARVWG